MINFTALTLLEYTKGADSALPFLPEDGNYLNRVGPSVGFSIMDAQSAEDKIV